jgi:hypothetical protein
MSNSMFVLALTGGAGLLAMWIHARFPRLAPERMAPSLLHALMAFALLLLTEASVGEGSGALFAAIMCLVLPALVYALLCAIWILRHAQTALGLGR